MRDVDDDGSIKWDQLIRTSLPSGKSQHFLRENDIIFTARGPRNVASLIGSNCSNTVCSPHFFVISVSEQQHFMPAFVAWQLNQKPAQRYFSMSAVGSSQVSISRGALESTPITFLDISKQERVVLLNHKVMQEKNSLKALITNRAKQMEYLANKILLSE
jgi:restriction endonuclease S subunit